MVPDAGTKACLVTFTSCSLLEDSALVVWFGLERLVRLWSTSPRACSQVRQESKSGDVRYVCYLGHHVLTLVNHFPDEDEDLGVR